MAEEKKKKYCPLKYTIKHGLEYCSKEKCAWWSEVENYCSIGLIGNALAGISRATK